MQTVSILPAEPGWMVRASGACDQHFAKGSAAETAAIKLATAMAKRSPVRVEIYLRDGSLARRFLVPPELVAA